MGKMNSCHCVQWSSKQAAAPLGGNWLLLEELLRKGVNFKFTRKPFLLISQFLQRKNIKKGKLFSGL